LPHGFDGGDTGDDCVAPQTNDLDVDGRGLVYLVDRFNGFDIIEYSS